MMGDTYAQSRTDQERHTARKNDGANVGVTGNVVGVTHGEHAAQPLPGEGNGIVSSSPGIPSIPKAEERGLGAGGALAEVNHAITAEDGAADVYASHKGCDRMAAALGRAVGEVCNI